MVRSGMMWVVLAGLLCAAEIVDPLHARRAAMPRSSRRTDAAWVALYFCLAPPLGWLVAAGASELSAHTPARAVVGTLPWPVQFVLALLGAELGAYGLHRLQHRVPVLWRIHSIHHSSAALRWWSAFRAHPLDTAMSHAVPVLAAAACGVGAGAIAASLLVVLVVTLFAHADVYVPGGWLERVVVTPEFHRGHHRTGREHTNLARVLPLWDRVFRTAPVGSSAGPLGSSGGAPRDGLWSQLAWGFGRGRQPISHTPMTSDTTLAVALAPTATVERTPRHVNRAASPSMTAISVSTSAAADPSGDFNSG